MKPQSSLSIQRDWNTPADDYQKILNAVGETILKIRGKYSIEIYKKDYSQLTPDPN